MIDCPKDSPQHLMQAPGKLPLAVVLANGLPALALSMLGIFFYAYLPKFYSDVVGIPVALLGGIIIATRLWDAVIDPLIGNLSDGTRSRFGRRRPWIALSGPPLVVATWLLLVPPSEGALSLYFLFVTLAFFLFWTTITIPYEALGAELTPDYDERHRLFGVREGAVIFGTLLAGALPVIVAKVNDLGTGDEDQRILFSHLSIILSIILVLALVVFLLVVKERPLGPKKDRTSLSPREYIAPIRRNPPYKILLVAYTVAAFGSMLPATLMFFFVEHVLQSERKELFLLLYLGTGVLFLPLWVALARKFEKKAAWLSAMALNTGAFVGALFLGSGDEIPFMVICIASGIGLGGTVAIPASMQADVIDYDEWETGTRNEGQLIGLWSIAKKLAQALGAGIAFPVLGMVGYVQGTGATQPQSAIWALSLLYAGVPCVCNAVAIVLAWKYPIDRATHLDIRDKIKHEREAVA